MTRFLLLLLLPLALACGGSDGGTDTTAADVPGDLATDVATDLPPDVPAAKTCSVRSHGAAGDGVTVDTAALQAAVDECAGTGGTVVVEAGTYYTGTVFLKSKMTLHLDEGATILGSQEMEDYEKKHVLYAEDFTDLVIEGPGTVTGNGVYWYGAHLLMPGNWRPSPMIRLVRGTNVTVRDLRLTHAAGWHLHFATCDNVLAERITIRATVGDNVISTNTDGIDIDGCRHVIVRHNDIETGDDCIVIKNSDDWARESYDIEVHDNVVSGWANALKIGTRPTMEVRDVYFHDNVVHASVESNPGTRNMSAMTIVSDAGADVHHVRFERITVKQTLAPFFFRVQERNLEEEGGTGETKTKPGRIYAITVKDVVVEDAKLAGLVLGIPTANVLAGDAPVGEALVFDNVQVNSTEGGTIEDRENDPGERNLVYPDAPYFGKAPAFGIFFRDLANAPTFRGNNQFTHRSVEATGDVPDARAAIVTERTPPLSAESKSAVVEGEVYERPAAD